jgi:hypothetical protein
VACATGVFGNDTGLAAGNSITAPATQDSSGHFASLALSPAGNPIVAYQYGTQDNNDHDLRLLNCNDPNCAFGGETITTLDATGNLSGQYISLQLDGSGFPVISYGHLNTGFRLVRCADPFCVAPGKTIREPDPNFAGGYMSSLALDSSSHPVMSYWDDVLDTLKVVHCNDPICDGDDETVITPDVGNLVGGWSSLVLDGAGNPVVSYYDFTNADLKLLHCGDPACAVPLTNSITSPDTAGIVGSNTSLALDGDGNPVVSYLDSTNSDLKILHCNDPNCDGDDESIVSPDTDGSVGYYTSLRLDASGFPVVSYYDDTNGDLMVLHCNDVDCAGDDESIVSVDAAGIVGRDTSLALDGSGNPVVAYFDPGGPDDTGFGDLKLLHCADADCAEAKPPKQVKPGDTDGDGCPDEHENGPDEGAGGLRDYLNPHDYFNPTHDGENRIDDVLKVIGQYFDDDDDGNPGQPPYEPGYDPDTDRRALGPNVWNLGPPNGEQRIDDILAVMAQYFHDCV